jgi:branched-chain amino acid transport system substrate-binding protein
MRIRAFLTVALLGTSLYALPAAPARSAPTGPPVEIPVMVPLTGFGAVTGVPEKDGFEAFAKYVNASGGIQNRPLHFTYYDDQTNPTVAVQLFNQIVAKGAQVVFGGSYSAMCKAIAPLAEQKGPIFYCLTPALRPTHGGYVFSSYYYPLDLLERALAYFHKRGWNRVGFLVSTDASGQEVDTQLDAMLNRPDMKGVQAVAHEHFDANDVSVAAQVAKIKAAQPQAVVIWTASGTATAFHALVDAGLDVPVAISPALMAYSAMTQYATILPKQLYFGAGKWAQYPNIGNGPIKDALVKYFDAFSAMGVRPDGGEALVWDPGLVVVDALRKAGPDASAAQLHAYIEQMHGFAGTNGFYDFRNGDQRGLNLDQVIMTVWSPAKGTWVLAQ